MSLKPRKTNLSTGINQVKWVATTNMNSAYKNATAANRRPGNKGLRHVPPPSSGKTDGMSGPEENRFHADP